MTVNSAELDAERLTSVKVELSAMPVTMPGSAIGRMTRNEIASRPKKR